MTGEELHAKWPNEYFPDTTPREKWLNASSDSYGLTNRDESCIQNILFGFCAICFIGLVIYYLSLHYKP